MSTRAETTQEASAEPSTARVPDAAGGAPIGEGDARQEGEIQWRKRRKRLGRKRDKFPRWVRALIWIITPPILWLAIYGIGLLLL